MRSILITMFVFVATIACSGGVNDHDYENKTVDQLKREVLDSTCNAQMRRLHEEKIREHEKKLFNNDLELKRYLRNTKNTIKCQRQNS